jgi:hypothetical protein
MKRTVFAVILLLLVGGAALAAIPDLRSWLARFLARRPQAEQTTTAHKQLFQCSMHPQIISDKPDICPICQMKLQPVDGGESAAPSLDPKERKVMFYRHPMRADVTSPVPAKDEMGMDYIPVYEEDLASGGEESVPGHAPFTLSIERQQLIGVTKAPVERRSLQLEVRAVGKVAYDPTLYQAIVEYREALRSRDQLKESQWQEALDGTDSLVRSARLRLRQLGLSEQQLREIAEAGVDPPVNLLLPGKTVWVYAQVYEYEVDLVRQGQNAEISAASMPGKTYMGRVVAIDPILNAMSRTARVRIEVPTPDASLRPETFVHAKIQVSLGEHLAVPEHAVLDTGEHQIVFVVNGSGQFDPRSVKLGRVAQGYYQVISGVTEGEQVVTSANFLIDSESRFRAALQAFNKPSAAPAPHQH